MPACTDCENLINRSCRASDILDNMPDSLILRDMPCNNYKQNTSTSDFIKNAIQEEDVKTKGYNCWLSKLHTVFDKLQQLNPTKPDDNTVGFIAFDVPDKPRVKLKTARFLTRKLNLNNGFLPDSAISSIANKINNKLFPDIRTELISGEQITEAYRKAVGSSSCMTNDYCDYTKLYEMNPDKIQMLVMYYMNDTARAILYKLDNGKYYLDRIYASCDALKIKMSNYADKQNWYKRETIYKLTTEQKEALTVSDLHYEDGHVPYMDTFGGSIYKSKLTLSYNDYDLNLDNTDGYIESGYVCECCSEYISEDDAISVGGDTYCEHCVTESFTYCECCGEYIDNDSIVYITDADIYVCEYHASRNYTQCEDCGDHYKDIYTITVDGKCICENCSDNYATCNDCGEWFNPEDVDENGYCSECKPEEDEPEENESIKLRFVS